MLSSVKPPAQLNLAIADGVGVYRPRWKPPVKPYKPHPFDKRSFPLPNIKVERPEVHLLLSATIPAENLNLDQFLRSLRRGHGGQLYANVLKSAIWEQTRQITQNYIWLREIVLNGAHYRNMPTLLKQPVSTHVFKQAAEQLVHPIFELANLYSEISKPSQLSGMAYEKHLTQSCEKAVGSFQRVAGIYPRIRTWLENS